MLILTRKAGQKIVISPSWDLDLDTTIREVFSAGPITLMINRVQRGQVRLGFEAPPNMLILRGELQTWGETPMLSECINESPRLRRIAAK